MQLVVRPVVLVIIVLRNLVVHSLGLVETESGLICPAARNILYSVASTSEHHERNAPRLDKLHALGVGFNRTVVGSKFVVGK